MTTKSQHILFILDRSGSMKAQSADVIGGFNTYIEEMRAEALKDGMETVVSLVTFADTYSVVLASEQVADIQPLTEETYRAIGNTALLDTVYDSVKLYKERIGQGVFGNGIPEAPPVLVIVFTDGEENASKTVNWDKVQKLIRVCETLGNWTFTYVGAHYDAWGQAERMQFKHGNVLDAAGMTVREATDQLVDSSKLHRAQYRDFDKKSSDDLFEAPASAGKEPGT
jgi:uncharacterized protein YegL